MRCLQKFFTAVQVWGLLFVLIMAFSVPMGAQTDPTLEGYVLFGGQGNQRGTGISIANSKIYISGTNDQIVEALVIIYDLNPTIPLWSTHWPGMPGDDEFLGIAATHEGIYPAGYSRALTYDGCGGKEVKGIAVKFPPSGGGTIWVNPQNFFPYRGGETFRDAATDGTEYVYAVGDGESYGWGHWAVVLVKYDFQGNVLNRVTEPGLTLGFDPCFMYQSVGQSDSKRVIVHNGKIYICGKSMLWGLGEDWAQRPFISQFDPDLCRQWKRRPTDLGSGIFNGLAGHGSAVYAVGSIDAPDGKDYLIQKYDESGTLLWSQTWGGSYDDWLTGAAVIEDRLFAVGSTRSEGLGGADVAIFELDPSTGNILWSSLFGGTQDDFANSAAAEGENLYIVGESRSFAGAGNDIGQNDILVLWYNVQTNNPPLALCQDITVEAGPNCTADASVDNGSCDPDGDPITISQIPSGPYPLGDTQVTLYVEDDVGAVDTCQATITVIDTTPPEVFLDGPTYVDVNSNGKMANKLTLRAEDNCPGETKTHIKSVEVFNQSGNPVLGKGIFEIKGQDIYVYPNASGWSIRVKATAEDATGNSTEDIFFMRDLIKYKK